MPTERVRVHAKRLQDKGYLLRGVRVGKPDLFYLELLIEALERIARDQKAKKKKSP